MSLSQGEGQLILRKGESKDNYFEPGGRTTDLEPVGRTTCLQPEKGQLILSHGEGKDN